MNVNEIRFRKKWINFLDEQSQEHIVVSPFYFSTHTPQPDPSIVIFLEPQTYLSISVDDQFASKCLKKNVKYSTDIFLEGGKTDSSFVLKQTNLFAKLEKNSYYLTRELDNLPSIIDQCYKEFYINEFNSQVEYHSLSLFENYFESITFTHSKLFYDLKKKMDTLSNYDKLKLSLVKEDNKCASRHKI